MTPAYHLQLAEMLAVYHCGRIEQTLGAKRACHEQMRNRYGNYSGTTSGSAMAVAI